jgi:hypothetical protein
MFDRQIYLVIIEFYSRLINEKEFKKRLGKIKELGQGAEGKICVVWKTKKETERDTIMLALKGKKRIFRTDEIFHKTLEILAKQVNLTMSEVIIDAVGLLSRLMFCHKCDAGVQFDNRYDEEIYRFILERYHYPDDEKVTKEFKERLNEIKEKSTKSSDN